MRFERLVIEAGPNSFTIAMHPCLTIIAGLTDVERDGLAGELLGALGPSRDGVHVELTSDDGRRLAVFRPAGARHRVVDIDKSVDVSGEFMNKEGRVDLVGQSGLDSAGARRMLRISQVELNSSAGGDELIARLAGKDQTELWSAAARMRVTYEELQSEAEGAGATPEDAELIDRVEQSHNSLESATVTQNRVRRAAIAIATAATVLSVPVAVVSPVHAAPILGVGALMTIVAVLFRAKVSRAIKAQHKALEAAGADSYMAFQVKRVNGLVSSDQNRRRLLLFAEDHRNAAARWVDVAGDVSVDWALENHELISVGARLRQDIDSLGSFGSAEAEIESSSGFDDSGARLAQALIGRLAGARRPGTSNESFPVILDEPFSGLESALKVGLLQLLSRTAGTPQAVLLTNDDDVASWARLEALAGELTILEPTPVATQSDSENIVA